ncbi:FAD-linked oxidoreductase sor8 [Cladobotryum mycophilum]|uniref:FAD-linked oxidoreductase sor8 n=1 Tax=Cladobotryum mycophilum TaxID=491253 RepID=A0ABR0SPA2_9HYPO
MAILPIISLVIALASGAALALPSLDASPPEAQGTNCKCFPGKPCWPTPSEWASFNRTVGGRLIATVPIAASCHKSNLAPYDAQACEALRSTWWFPETHLGTSSSPMAPFFANASCDPFTAPEAQCVIGAYVQYAVRAASVADYQATLAFATKKNIRIVIRNTGHDYYGKSTGAGALGLWTHWLKDTHAISNYRSAAYSGKALKLGAGVGVLEAYKAADAAGVAVVGGACATVGIAGGYSQGGGHGPLMSHFGLGADQVLEWEVVTAQGKHLVASPSQNGDLYWALTGGGGGTYAAVVSVTVRAHQLTRVSAANLTFTNANVSDDVFYSAIHKLLTEHPRLGQGGAWSAWTLIPGVFSMSPLVGPGLHAAELHALLEPTLSFLNQSDIGYDYHIQEFDSFLDTYTTMFPYNNITAYNIGGRMIPKSLVSTDSSAETLLDALKFILSQGGGVSGSSLDVSGFPKGGVHNSVNPAWRTAILNLVIGLAFDALDFDANFAIQKKMTETLIPRLEALTPGGGTYLNEGDFRQPNWQKAYYGDNYIALRKIKAKYDPNDLFYGLTAVGSERWTVQKDGSLCRA